MRPTGKLHLGNYMGALANWVKLQDEYECYFFIADWHALTTDYADPSRLKLNTLDVALDYLAAGLDPEKSTIFIQSHVPQHAELHLLFSMITPLGWLERVPSYKEQQENITGKDLHTYGFLGYPLLQAADILIYQPQFVPVGQDQVAHVELTREVARRFKSMYRSNVFPEPDVLLTPSPKLLGTDGRKMSKSYGNTIGLTETPESVAQKVLAMSTNGQRIRQTDSGDPDQCPVGGLHKVFSSSELTCEIEAACRSASISCKDCKGKAADSLAKYLAPIHARRQMREAGINQTWELLIEQSRKASIRAEKTMVQVREVLGLGRELGYLGGIFANPLVPQKKAWKFDASELTQSARWKTQNSEQQSKELIQFWIRSTSREAALTRDSSRSFSTLERELEEPFLTSRKKRALVMATTFDSGGWHFRIPSKSYEVWTLLCLEPLGSGLNDFVVPQHVYSQYFAQAKRSLKKGEPIHVFVNNVLGIWQLVFPGLHVREVRGNAIVIEPSEPLQVNEFLESDKPLRDEEIKIEVATYLGNYDPLR